MKPEWELLTRSIYDPEVFWVMVTAVATVVLVFVAYWQLRSLAQTSRSDFLYRLKKDFFSDEARRLIFLAEHGLLKFHSNDVMAHFEIVGRRGEMADRMKELGISGDTVSVYLVDDVLLGPMEDIGVLEKLGMVSLGEVYEAFVTYVNICVESKPLKEYLDWSRKDKNDDDVYDNVLRLYQRLKEKTPKIRERKRREVQRP